MTDNCKRITSIAHTWLACILELNPLMMCASVLNEMRLDVLSILIINTPMQDALLYPIIELMWLMPSIKFTIRVIFHESWADAEDESDKDENT